MTPTARARRFALLVVVFLAASASTPRFVVAQEPAAIEWTTITPARITATSGATFTKLFDGSWLVSGAIKPNDTYTIEVETLPKGVTAFRIERSIALARAERKAPMIGSAAGRRAARHACAPASTATKANAGPSRASARSSVRTPTPTSPPWHSPGQQRVKA